MSTSDLPSRDVESHIIEALCGERILEARLECSPYGDAVILELANGLTVTLSAIAGHAGPCIQIDVPD
jgi:hypothetical protein